MRKKVTVLAVVTALLVSGTVAMAAVPTMTAANDGDDGEDQTITECTTIDEPGEYTLGNDITNESADPCIDVQTSDVVVDGDDHTIDGVDKDAVGIQTGPNGNVTIEDVTVTGFDVGVESPLDEVVVADSDLVDNNVGALASSETGVLTVENSDLSNNTEDGLAIHGGDATVTDSRLADNGENGAELEPMSDVTFTDNVIAGNGVGIDAVESTVTTTDNAITDNEETGLQVNGEFTSTGDVVTGNGVGISASGAVVIADTEVRDNEGDGITLGRGYVSGTAEVTDSVIADNGGDGVSFPGTGEFEDVQIHGSTIANNSGLGVNNTLEQVVDATGNDWGSDDGPSSADDPDAPFEDPVTGALADGSGDEVSEHPEKPGVSNVHFTTNPPEDGEGDDVAYQIDLAKGEVIENLGEDEDAYYGGLGQQRLLQAMSMTADGETTDKVHVPLETVTTSMDGCHISYDAIEYDEDTGEATVTVAHDEDGDCDEVTITLAAYELPEGTTDFVYDRADEQELQDYETVTLAPGETTTVTIDVHDGDE